MVYEVKSQPNSRMDRFGESIFGQYDHVVDIAPNCMALMTMEKNEIKSFKEYTHRWRDVASQVQPSLTKKEITFFFANTLSNPYYDKMIGNAMRNFTKMVWSGELIEHGIKNMKIEGKTTPVPA